MKHRNGLRAIVLATVLLIAVDPGVARAEEESAGAEAGLGAAAALCTLVYGPVKVVYAALGLIFGGMAWGLSGGDQAVMDAVVTPAVRGDYVVTPSHLRGEGELEFIGRQPGYGAPTRSGRPSYGGTY